MLLIRFAGTVVLAAFWLGCRTAPLGNPELVKKFSPGVFTEEDRLNGGLPKGYGTILKAAGEPRLSAVPGGFGVRLAFSEAFDDSDTVIRLEGDEGSARLVIKRVLTTVNRPEEIRLKSEVTKEITPAAFARLQRLAERVPRLDGFDGVLGNDGWSCLLEIVEAGQYRAMYRWTPDHEMRRRKLKEFVALAEFMIEEAGVGPGKL